MLVKFKRALKYNYIPPSLQNESLEKEESRESWNIHINQNESIISDLFHGQFRIRTKCAKCRKESVTYSPFNQVTLPVPHYEIAKLDLFFVQYNINDDNFKLEINIKDTDLICDLRAKIKEKYGIATDSYLIAWVLHYRINVIYSNQMLLKDLISRHGGGLTILYQINPKLKPSLQNVMITSETDDNYGIDPDYVKMSVNMMQDLKGVVNIPRVLWVHKDWTLKELHMKILDYFIQLFIIWYKDNDEEI